MIKKRIVHVIDNGINRGKNDEHTRKPLVHKATMHVRTLHYEPLCTFMRYAQFISFDYPETTKAVTCPKCKEM